jgi:hypothetical protein
LAAVRDIVVEWARRHNLAGGEVEAFLKKLFSEWTMSEPIADMAQKVWTSEQTLADREFCSIFNELIRNDRLLDDKAADQVTTLAHAINRNLVTRGVGGASWPDGSNSFVANACFRGGGFCDTALTRAFFVEGKRFRTGGFVATSYMKYIAETFIARVRMNLHTHTRDLCHGRPTVRFGVPWAGEVQRSRQRVCAVEDRARPRPSLQPRQPRNGVARPGRGRVFILGVLGVRGQECDMVAHTAGQVATARDRAVRSTRQPERRHVPRGPAHCAVELNLNLPPAT